MPSDFGNVQVEVLNCLRSAAIFDFSFLLRIQISGATAIDEVSRLCGRNLRALPIGRICYALLADGSGLLLSDLTIWRTGRHCLEIMTGRAADWEVISAACRKANLDHSDLSAQTAVLAIQGPETFAALSAIDPTAQLSSLGYFSFVDCVLGGIDCRIGRLGFTGLPGVEILCHQRNARDLWRQIVLVAPGAGFTAADQIRLKAGLALFSNEFAPPVSAADAGLKRFRDLGATVHDQRRARVARVSFARCLDYGTEGIAQGMKEAVWSAGDSFPPAPGNIAITSLAKDENSNQLLGMGYIAAGDRSQNLSAKTFRIERSDFQRVFAP